MQIEIENIPRTIELVRLEGAPPFGDGAVELVVLDQTQLPYAIEYLHIRSVEETVSAIKLLKVRGAPALGIAGASAVTLKAFEVYADILGSGGHFDPEGYRREMQGCAGVVREARPTAVNLAYAVDACLEVIAEELDSGSDAQIIANRLFEFVQQMCMEDENANREMGRLGASLLERPSGVLTHCNAGSLATAFFGTALGAVYEAAIQGKIEMVWADETRPVGQGSRLTVWELSRAHVPVTLICDDMAATVMGQGLVDAVFVGADRITAKGDVANKIGTLGVAILAKHFNIPFYVVAPTSSIDLSIADASQIPIEIRDKSEVLEEPIDGVEVYNPAFDITPADLVSAIVTEAGIFKPNEISRIVK